MYESMVDIKKTLLTQHYQEHKDVFMSLARRRIGDFWAEDCVQEMYEGGLRYIDSVPLNEKEMNLYLYTILSNVIKAYQRGSFPTSEIEEDMWVGRNLQRDMQDEKVIKETLEFLKDYPEEQRNIIYAYLIQGEDAQYVSRSHGVSVGHVWNICSKFREAAKEKFYVSEEP